MVQDGGMRVLSWAQSDMVCLQLADKLAAIRCLFWHPVSC